MPIYIYFHQRIDLETLQNELISFGVITFMVLMLAYVTHKKQEQIKRRIQQEQKDKDSKKQS